MGRLRGTVRSIQAYPRRAFSPTNPATANRHRACESANARQQATVNATDPPNRRFRDHGTSQTSPARKRFESWTEYRRRERNPTAPSGSFDAGFGDGDAF
ncbi:MAG: hypothetical protein CMJ22_01295 [Phycisphaerae bacterium]|nr:hypothetical protein [Phycisphaerae bacterium]